MDHNPSRGRRFWLKGSTIHSAKGRTILASFADHLKRVDQDSSVKYKIADAVAFGDFLSGRTRVQAADVGIRLEPRNPEAHDNSAGEQSRQETFLRQLRGRTPLVNPQPYAEWMGARTHQSLL